MGRVGESSLLFHMALEMHVIGISQQLLIVQWEFFAITKFNIGAGEKHVMGEASFKTIYQTFTEKAWGEGGGIRRGEQTGGRGRGEDDFQEDSVLGRFTIPGHNVCEMYMYVSTCPVC